MKLNPTSKPRKQYTIFDLHERQKLFNELCEVLFSNSCVWDFASPEINDILTLELVNGLRLHRKQINELKYLLN